MNKRHDNFLIGLLLGGLGMLALSDKNFRSAVKEAIQKVAQEVGMQEHETKQLKKKYTHKQMLQQDLEQALKLEQYERAAVLRDMLKKFDSNKKNKLASDQNPE